MAEGRIIKGVGGFYYVRTKDGSVYECRAKGKFRKDKITPLIGDNVVFTMPKATSMGVVDDILPRINTLVRPAVANIDMLMIVMSAGKPEADLLMADKLILYARYSGFKAVLLINKIDSADEWFSRQYEKSGVPIIWVSAKTGQGFSGLRKMVSGGKCACFAGQSAVGKSSILNRLMGEDIMDTGGLSAKTDRGVHTTRHSELFITPEGGIVIDTPGFSVLQAIDIEPNELSSYYEEFCGISCRFAGCLHKSEPECGVRNAAGADADFRERYERYIKILNEIIQRKEKKYD